MKQVDIDTWTTTLYHRSWNYHIINQPLTIHPAPTAPSKAPPNAEQTPDAAQSAAIVCFNETLF